jgi:hypothetical protein
LKYRYEQLYVNERLDTSVSEDKVHEYYQQHKDAFVLRRPLVKARYLCIHTDSPALKQIRKKMCSSEVSEVIEADSLAFSSAYRFTTWNDAWIDASTLAREFGSESASVMASVRKGWIERADTLGVMSIAFVTELIPAGKIAPLEYSAPFIRDMIISARKQSLIATLEQDLLNDARESGKFEILK